MKILVINGHPGENSFTKALAKAYFDGARASGAAVSLLNLRELKFDLSLHEGYQEITPLEPDLIEAQKLIRQADHLVFFYPHWWGSAPALLKGFIDRVFLPGFAFRHREQSPLTDRLLSGRTGEIWLCSDSPRWWFLFKYWNSPIRWLKSATLEFCGIKPVEIQCVDWVRFLSPEQRMAWLRRAFNHGKAQARHRRETHSPILPEFLPQAQFRAQVSTVVNGSPEECFQAYSKVTLKDMPLANFLGKLRYGPAKFFRKEPPTFSEDVPFVEQLLKTGTLIVFQNSAETISGSAGKYHQIFDQEFRSFQSAQELLQFQDPEFQKLFISLRAEPISPNKTKLIMEHWTYALSEASRKKFAKYWILIHPFGNLAGWLLLRATKRRAETQKRAQSQLSDGSAVHASI